MWKLVGAALLMGGGLRLGLGAAGELSRRVRALEAWIAALALMESELAFRIPDLPQLLETLSKRAGSPAKEVFGFTCGTLDRLSLFSFADIWQEAITTHDGDLTAGDVDVLLRLGEVLGRYGWEDQRRVTERARLELEERRARAQKELEQKGKAYGALGLTLGAFLTILLI